MIRIKSLTFIVFFVGILIANSQNLEQEGTHLRVMTYNIWNGFDWGKDEERREKLADWINSKKPDVVALQELCGYTEEALLEDAKKWGHHFAVILKTDGYPVGLTSNKSIILKEKAKQELWHGMLHCETWGVDFFVVHLSPADRNFRFKETEILITKVENISNENYIVLGDFNAHSPFDGDQDLIDDSLLKKVRKGDAKKKEEDNLLDSQFDYSVIASFLATRMIDVTQRFVPAKDRFTFPAKALIGIWQTAEEVEKNKHRLDYILTSRSMAMICSNAWVFNGQETAMLSDHYPVMAEFRIKQSE